MPEPRENYVEKIGQAETSEEVLAVYLEARTAKNGPAVKATTLQFAAAKKFHDLKDIDHAFMFTDLAERSQIAEQNETVVNGTFAAANTLDCATLRFEGVVTDLLRGLGIKGTETAGEMTGAFGRFGTFAADLDASLTKFGTDVGILNDIASRIGNAASAMQDAAIRIEASSRHGY